MRGNIVVFALLALASRASAQSQQPSGPSPAPTPGPSVPPQPPPPAPQATPPAPPPQQQQHAQVPPAQAPWYRLTLNDGRVVDVQIVGGDATNYHVLMAGTVYSLPRANVVSSIALVPAVYAPPAPAAPPPAPPPARMVDDDKDPFVRNPRAVGGIYFGLSYMTTVAIALARRDNDPDAVGAIVPVAGPLLWALTNDEDDAFEDGWDWLAAFDSLIQGAGLYLVLTGTELRSNKRTVRLHPLTGRNHHGFALSGTF